MGQKKKKEKNHRTQLLVKPDDKATLQWLSAQSNKSGSLKLLIKEAIARYGYVDLFDAKMAEWYGDQLPQKSSVVERTPKPGKTVSVEVKEKASVVPNTQMNTDSQFAMSGIADAIVSFNSDDTKKDVPDDMDLMSLSEETMDRQTNNASNDVSLGDLDAMLAEMKGSM